MSDPSGRDGPESFKGELESERMSRPVRWVLLDGDRRLLALGLLVGLLFVLGGALVTDAGAVANEGPLTRLFASLVGGNLTLITVVITINQLILSREFGTPSELRDRISDVVDYRHEVEKTAHADVSPVTPRAFLEFLATEIGTHAEEIRSERASIPDQQYREAVEAYADTLVHQSETINETLEKHPGGAFNTLLTILDADFTSDRYTAERLRATGDEDLPESVDDTLAEILELLEYIGAARQYFKTLYMQQELTALSQRILYAGMPAVTASLLGVWIYGHETGAALSSPVLDGVVLATTLVALSPLAILVAYVLRVTTITRQTMSLMPFKTHELTTS